MKRARSSNQSPRDDRYFGAGGGFLNVPWTCQECRRSGSVRVFSNRKIEHVQAAIKSDHARESARCEADAMKVHFSNGFILWKREAAA